MMSAPETTPTSIVRRPAEATLQKVTRRIMPLIIITYVLSFLDRTNLGLAQRDISADLGIGAAAYGLGAGLFFVVYACLEIPSNLVMTRVGARRWLFRIALTWGLVAMLSAFIWDEWSFYGSRMLLGAAEAGFYPGLLYYVTLWYPHRDRAKVQGLVILGAPIASVIGGPLGGWLLGFDGFGGLHGWQWMFLVEGLPTIIVAFIILKHLPDRPTKASWLEPEEALALERFVEEENRAGALRHGNAGFWRVLRDRQFVIIAIAYFSGNVSTYALSYFLPTIISQIGGVTDDFVIGVLSSAPWFLAGIGCILITRRATARNSTRFWILVCLAATVVGLGVAATFGDWIGFAGFCFFGVFMVAVNPLLLSLIGLRMSGVTLAASLAAANMFGLIGGFVGPFAMGAAQELSGGDASAGVWLIVLLAGTCLVLCLFLDRNAVHDPGHARPT